MFKITRFIVFLFITISSVNRSFAQTNPTTDLVWQSIGGKEKWETIQFVAFTAKGNTINNSLSDDTRSFLIDLQSGDARFEGTNKDNTSITLLFNFKKNTVSKYFVNGKEDNNRFMLKPIIQQLITDTKLLFSPTVVAQKGGSADEKESKLIEGQKVVLMHINTTTALFNSPIRAEIALEESTGEIRFLEMVMKAETVHYEVSNYKQIGDGVKLPTSFIASENEKKSCIFTAVSSFVNVESAKFNAL